MQWWGARLPSRSHLPLIRPASSGWSSFGIGESLLVSAASLLARMQPTMPTPGRNGVGSREKERLARADSRAAYPCPLTRRFREPAGAVENHCPVGSAGRPYGAGGKHQIAGVEHILASHCRGSSHFAITRCRHGSSPIASALAVDAPSITRFPLTPCLQAKRGAEIRIDTSTTLSDQITGPPAVAAFALVAPVERFPTPLDIPSPTGPGCAL
ncbi:hypothetical protein C7974DRAFT_455284 [Boeremia exigua]|uniref:uncharacterized protein n=1 Tax=Boeremia exigua TaxID=749465 RepID=UPI001E8DBD71|nr:uncharacterized protein C7974DRAFT_455284 [Boeremia exigua]KAH6625304.1 hypothetical protein C7974DRAFT_455284 [Boeremia exigua]